MPVAAFASFGPSRKSTFDKQPYTPSRKRKRHQELVEPSDSLQSAPNHLSTSTTSPLTSIDAGPSSDEEDYRYPFPHAAPRTHATARLHLSDNEPPILTTSESLPYVVSSNGEELPLAKSSVNSGLRQQHYDVLISILHRCLLEGDYARASRAWGMLLRTETHGHPLDIRYQERWGIGAELLLRPNSRSDDVTTLQSLAKAKDYYERLILQYPYRKTTPDSTNSLTFYPVMFGIWIYTIQLRYKVAMKSARLVPGNPADTILNDDAGSDGGDAPSSPTGATGTQIDNIRLACERAVQQAKEVVERLGELLISPPFSDHAALWRIQGMLFVWISHLMDHAAESLQRSGHGPTHGKDEPVFSSVRQSSGADADAHAHADADAGATESFDHEEALNKGKEAFARVLDLGEAVDTSLLQVVGLGNPADSNHLRRHGVTVSG
ncbi:MAG: hypothetical protein Q9183_001322 [Haloplaca sp. 2 TL-2023]